MPKISPELLSVLRCPVTGSPLEQDGEDHLTTAAGPSGEKLRYPIEDGIPLLLPPELLPAAAAASSSQHDGGRPDGSAPAGS
ncbi:Trm112 family protein [Micrococcaceae bacterium Sec5.8]